MVHPTRRTFWRQIWAPSSNPEFWVTTQCYSTPACSQENGCVIIISCIFYKKSFESNLIYQFCFMTNISWKSLKPKQQNKITFPNHPGVLRYGLGLVWKYLWLCKPSYLIQKSSLKKFPWNILLYLPVFKNIFIFE